MQKGDSLWKIARVYGISVAELAAYNNIAPSKPIRIGQKLVIPAGSKAVKTQKPVEKKTSEKKVQKKAKGKTAGKVEKAPIPADGIYIVKEGDSFSKIAAKYGLKVSAIAAANPGVSSNRLQIGQKLVIPGKGGAAAVAATPAQPQTSSGEMDALLKNAESAPVTQAPVPTTGSDSQAPAPTTVSDSQAPAPTGAQAPAPTEVKTEVVSGNSMPFEVDRDGVTLDEFARQHNTTAAALKQLNTELPADGVLKKGNVIFVPVE